LNRDEIVEAINLTVAANVALNQTRIGSISKWKACGYANANRNALFAVELAARGMTGPPRVFEGRDGFFNVVSKGPFELAPFGGAGRPFRIMQCHVKQFPLGNFSQTVVTAVLEARKLVNDVGDIREIHVRTSQSGLSIMADGPEKWRPANRETADHSIPYTTGVALKYGTVELKYFGDEYLHDADLLGLVDRVKCAPSEEATRRGAEMNLCDLDLVMASGERKSVRVEYHRGHWMNPMSDAEMEAKFRGLVGMMLPAAPLDALLAQLWSLEELPETGALIEMLADAGPSVLITHPSVPVRSVRDLIALAKARPGDLNYASGAPGATSQLAAELFKSMTGVRIVWVPYKDNGPGVLSVIAGQTQVMFANTPGIEELAKAGRVRILAVTTLQPSPVFPGVPTVADAGVPGYESLTIDAVVVPARTPAAIVNRLNQEIVRALTEPGTKKTLFNSGVVVVGSSPEELGAFIKSSIAKWSKVIKEAGIRAN
jgi:hypothetical protein